MERSDELRDFVLLYYQAIASGDEGFLQRHMSRGDELLVVGAQPREWWTGYATAIKAYSAQMMEKSVGIALVAGDPQAYREGSVGWVADRVQIRLPDGTEIPCRLTMVWHEENGCWKIVQHHLSVGVGARQSAGHSFATPELGRPIRSRESLAHSAWASRNDCVTSVPDWSD